jgi:hypothetical protein
VEQRVVTHVEMAVDNQHGRRKKGKGFQVSVRTVSSDANNCQSINMRSRL